MITLKISKEELKNKLEIKDGKDGINGKDGITGMNGLDGKDGIDGNNGINGKDGSSDTSEEIRDKLEELKDDERLDVSAIKGLRDEIDTLKFTLATRKVVYSTNKTRIQEIDLSSSLDGVTKTFSIGTHFGIISVESDSAPFGAFRRTTDYTEVGTNIVFTSAIDASISLATGHSLIVRYLGLGGFGI